MGQGGDLINFHINCPNIRDIPNNQIPLQKVGDDWGFDTRSVTVQYRPYAIPHVTKREMDSGWKSGYYPAILSGKEDRDIGA